MTEPKMPLLARLRRLPPVGHAVRVEWSDGTHEFQSYARTSQQAVRQCKRDAGWLAMAPHSGRRFAAAAAIQISWTDFTAHNEHVLCRSPNCPNGPAVVLATQPR
jgi:hypothetical protein